jgi:hypothetical protein
MTIRPQPLKIWLARRESNPQPFGYSWRFQIRTGLIPLSPTAECSAIELHANKTNFCRTSFSCDVQNLLLKHTRTVRLLFCTKHRFDPQSNIFYKLDSYTQPNMNHHFDPNFQCCLCTLQSILHVDSCLGYVSIVHSTR